MKKIFTVLPLLIISLTACRKELDTKPLDAFSVTNFYNSETNVQLALNALYRGSILTNAASFNPVDWWDYNGLLWLELATDNAYDRRLDNSVFNRLTNGTLVNSNGALQFYWTGSYYRIAHCNDFLRFIHCHLVNIFKKIITMSNSVITAGPIKLQSAIAVNKCTIGKPVKYRII